MREIGRDQLALLGDGERVELVAGDAETRLLLIAGKPLNEPIARAGPFVMNTPDEIRQAFSDYQSGKF
jgi:redox-sensitive bicupin YhaK (pirin superfamily)